MKRSSRWSSWFGDDADFAEFESTCELVKEMLHQEAEMSDFFETVTIGERILTEFVKAGKTHLRRRSAALFRRPCRSSCAESVRSGRSGSRRPAPPPAPAIVWRSSARSSNENHEIGNLEVRRYLDNFDWEALMAITESIGDLQHPHHREAVKDYLVSSRAGTDSDRRPRAFRSPRRRRIRVDQHPRHASVTDATLSI